MKVILMIIGIILASSNLGIAQYSSLWSVNIGTDTEDDLLYKIEKRGGQLLGIDSDHPEERRITGRYDTFDQAQIVFLLTRSYVRGSDTSKKNIVYAGYAQIKATGKEEAQRIYNYLLDGMHEKYGTPNDSGSTRVDWLGCGLDDYRRRLELKEAEGGFEVVVSIFNTGIREGLKQLSIPIDLANGLKDY